MEMLLPTRIASDMPFCTDFEKNRQGKENIFEHF